MGTLLIVMMMTFNLIFLAQRTAIFAFYARRNETGHLCFVTQENMLVFGFQIFF